MKITCKFNNGQYYIFTFPMYKRGTLSKEYRQDIFLHCIGSLYGTIHNIFCLRKNGISVLNKIQNKNERFNKKSIKYNKKHMNKKKHSYSIHSLEELSVVKDTHLYNDKEHHFKELTDILKEERKYNFIDHKVPIHVSCDNFTIDTTDKYRLLDYYDFFKSNEFYVKRTSYVLVWNKLHLSICREKIIELFNKIKLIFEQNNIFIKKSINDNIELNTNVEEFEREIKTYLKNETEKNDIIINNSNYVEVKEILLFMILLYKTLLDTKQSYVACIFSYNR